MSDKQVLFSVTPENSEVYRLKAEFYEGGQKTSESINSFMFRQLRQPEEGTNFDFFTKNSTSTSRMGRLFRQVFEGRGGIKIKQDLEIMDAVRRTLDISPLPENTQTVIVVDLNDSQAKYANIDQINKCQKKVVEEYLQKPTVNRFQETHLALKSFNPNFMIGEGPLKYNLLREDGIFTPEQQEFLVSREGRPYHCQLAEFFMNGFKFGQTAELEGRSLYFNADDYVHYIGEGPEVPFEPKQRSIVLLPPQYWDMYSGEEDAAFVKAIKTIDNIFKISVEGNESTQMTTMTVDKVGE